MIFYDSHNDPHEFSDGDKLEWRISAYAAILNEENKLLLVTPTWRDDYDMPGGGVEQNESIFEGLIRECYEETGYKVKLQQQLPFYISETNFFYLKYNSFCHSINFFYNVELESVEQHKEVINVAEPNEIAKVEWVDLSSITKNNCHFMYLPAIDELKKRQP